MPHIGTLSESSLHAALKHWYARPEDQVEIDVEGLVIDIVREDELIEIQTGNFSSLRSKLARLLPSYTVRIVYPLAREKWIVRETGNGRFVRRRKSPKRGRLVDVFQELIRIHSYLMDTNLILEVLFTQQEEIWRDDGRGSWRRKHWSIYDRRLLQVMERVELCGSADYLTLIPDDLVMPFSNRELATALGCRISLAQKMTYTMRNMGLIEVVGKSGNALLFQDAVPGEQIQ